MTRFVSFLQYFLKAKKRHNIHSPFVYEMSDQCFRKPISNADHQIMLDQKRLLSNIKDTITITDFGAGSKHLGNERKISEIFKISRSHKKYATALYQLSQHYQPKRILELGTSLAWGTLHLHLGFKDAQIDTVEGCPETFDVAKSFFPVASNAIQFHNALFDYFIARLTPNHIYDLIFIDGHHNGAALLKYMELLKPYTHNHTIWILDDIRWSVDMWEAWQSIARDENFHVTIDLLRMGIVVQRIEQRMEHFSLRL